MCNKKLLGFLVMSLCALSLYAKSPFRRGLLAKMPQWNEQNRQIIHELWHNVHEVEAGKLYRTHQLSALVLGHFMDKYGIKTVINLRGQQPGVSWWEEERAMVLARGAGYFNLPMSAMKMTPKWILHEMLNIYDNAPLPIMIHCQGGSDRTGEAAAIWVLEKMAGSKKDALKQLSWRFGHIACPNKDALIQMWGGRNWLANQYSVGINNAPAGLLTKEA